LKNLFLFLPLCFAALITSAQVGINTADPTAELHIAATDVGPAALRLEPQLNPTGTESGQIAIIGTTARRPYLYDPVRSKWLGLQLTGWQFNQGLTRSSDGGTIRYGGNQESNTAGPLMPRPGTVVYVSARATTGNLNKEFSIVFKNAADAVVATQSITLVNGQAVVSDVNLDFPAGSYMIVTASADGAESRDVSFVVWTKWRPQN